jgi:deoxyribodipyrimidine photo-lyase
LWFRYAYTKCSRDLLFENPNELPDIFTNYRKKVEPLREKPRAVLSTPSKDSLPPYPPAAAVPSQHAPFAIPDSLDGIQAALFKPLENNLIKDPPARPTDAQSAHPFLGGETRAQSRLDHLISSGSMTTYHQTRNGLLGSDFSSKLSAWLALGCITSRQIRTTLLSFEDGKRSPIGTNSQAQVESWSEVQGYRGRKRWSKSHTLRAPLA